MDIFVRVDDDNDDRCMDELIQNDDIIERKIKEKQESVRNLTKIG